MILSIAIEMHFDEFACVESNRRGITTALQPEAKYDVLYSEKRQKALPRCHDIHRSIRDSTDSTGNVHHETHSSLSLISPKHTYT